MYDEDPDNDNVPAWWIVIFPFVTVFLIASPPGGSGADMDPQYERLSISERLALYEGEYARLKKRLLLRLITQDEYRQQMLELARRLGL